MLLYNERTEGYSCGYLLRSENIQILSVYSFYYHFLTKYITNLLSSGEAKKKVIVKMTELKPSRKIPMPLMSMPVINLYILGQ